MIAGVLLLAAELTLPIATVGERLEMRTSVFPGRLEPVAQVDVVPQVSGEIVEVTFSNGAVVAAGDVLYRIDSVRYAAAVKNAEAKLAECRANVRYAELSYERHKKLLATRAVSIDAVDNALSQRDSARAALAAAEAEVVSARDDLKHCTIVAPIHGKLGSTAKTRGNYVERGGTKLVTLVQNRPMRVGFSVSNREFLDYFGGRNRRYREEASVSLTLANGTRHSETGMPEYVDNVVDDLTDTIKLFALFPNEGRQLRAGGIVTVALSSRRGVPRLAIPPTAVLQDTQGPYVWVVGADGKAERRAIARGDLAGDVLFVEKGLRLGERIVADGGHRVRRGDRVKAAPEAR